MPWEVVDLKELAEKLGINYAEVQAKHKLISKIKSIRQKHDLTQGDLARILGKSQSWIAKVESGIETKNISFEALFKILSVLGYDFKITTKRVSRPEKLAA